MSACRYVKNGAAMTSMTLRIVTAIFFTCAIMIVVVAAIDASSHFALADYIVKKFGEIMTLSVGAIVGLLADQRIGSKRRH